MAALLFGSATEFREDGYFYTYGSGATGNFGYPVLQGLFGETRKYPQAVDRRLRRVAYNSDSTLYDVTGNEYGVSWVDCYTDGRYTGLARVNGYGAAFYAASGYTIESYLATLAGVTVVPASTSMAVPVAELKTPTPTELWVSMDLRYYFTNVSTLNDPANLSRLEKRCTIFTWGDLQLTLRSITNPAVAPTRGDVNFDLYNAGVLLGTVTVPNVNDYLSAPFPFWHWIYCKIHAKLDSSSGAFEVTLDGNSASFTGINSVSVTPAVDATHIYVSPGMLGRLNGGTTGPIQIGTMDNLYIDDAEFCPIGRPAHIYGTNAGVDTDNEWVAVGSGATTLVNALVGYANDNTSRVGAATGAGALAAVNISAPSRSATPVVSDCVGVQFLAGRVTNVNLDDAAAMKQGIRVTGVGTEYGTVAEGQLPPAWPSFINTGIDTLWTRSDGTRFVYDNFDGTNNGTQMLMQVIDPTP